jgi:hypothetical protein
MAHRIAAGIRYASCMRLKLLAAVLVAFTLEAQAQTPPAPDSAQRAPTPGRIRGRVVEDSTGAPIVGALVLLPKSSRSIRTDSAGRYEFAGLAPETTLVIVRAPGFEMDSTSVAVRNRLLVNLELRLAYERVTVARRAVEPQPLPAATVEAVAPDLRGRMGEFYERKRIGMGRFIDREMLAKWDNRKTSDLFGTVGGVQVKTGGMRGWISNGRANDASCTFCRDKDMFSIVSEADFSAGARQACYMDVWLDGSRVYQFGMTPPQPLFDVNSLSPQTLEGIEVYVGAAQIPPRYNSSSAAWGCGVILFWTRISPDKKP